MDPGKTRRFGNTRVYPNHSAEPVDVGDTSDTSDASDFDDSDDSDDSDEADEPIDDEYLEGVLWKMFSEDVSQGLFFQKAVWETGIFMDLVIQASCRALELAHSKDPADERTCLTTLCFAIWCHTQLVLVKRKIKKKYPRLGFER